MYSDSYKKSSSLLGLLCFLGLLALSSLTTANICRYCNKEFCRCDDVLSEGGATTVAGQNYFLNAFIEKYSGGWVNYQKSVPVIDRIHAPVDAGRLKHSYWWIIGPESPWTDKDGVTRCFVRPQDLFSEAGLRFPAMSDNEKDIIGASMEYTVLCLLMAAPDDMLELTTRLKEEELLPYWQGEKCVDLKLPMVESRFITTLQKIVAGMFLLQRKTTVVTPQDVFEFICKASSAEKKRPDSARSMLLLFLKTCASISWEEILCQGNMELKIMGLLMLAEKGYFPALNYIFRRLRYLIENSSKKWAVLTEEGEAATKKILENSCETYMRAEVIRKRSMNRLQKLGYPDDIDSTRALREVFETLCQARSEALHVKQSLSETFSDFKSDHCNMSELMRFLEKEEKKETGTFVQKNKSKAAAGP